MTFSEPGEVLGGVLRGQDNRYRVWTADCVDFDAVPALADGGPVLVAVGGWSTRVQADGDSGQWYVDATRTVTYEPLVVEQSPVHGVLYPSEREAWRAAYDAGLCGFLVQEVDRYRYGLGATAASA